MPLTIYMWNFARTQHPSSLSAEIGGPINRDLDQIFGNLFEPLEPPTPRREYTESPAATAVEPADADDELHFEEAEDQTEDAA